MNNLLPARTGEFVRAHMGAKVTGESRALVLGTIASERLVDGLTISMFFVLFSMNLSNHQYFNQLLFVAGIFTASTAIILLFLFLRPLLMPSLKKLNEKHNSKTITYVGKKALSFLDGLAPLFERDRLILVLFWSILIWSLELLVYVFVSQAYDANINLSEIVLFMVAVNFSSLIPAAPGGIGVIEAAATAILTSVGIEHEKALTMVITQHMIQYIVVGILGGLSFLTWKGKVELSNGET